MAFEVVRLILFYRTSRSRATTQLSGTDKSADTETLDNNLERRACTEAHKRSGPHAAMVLPRGGRIQLCLRYPVVRLRHQRGRHRRQHGMDGMERWKEQILRLRRTATHSKLPIIKSVPLPLTLFSALIITNNPTTVCRPEVGKWTVLHRHQLRSWRAG
jgi:hypothetical protein